MYNTNMNTPRKLRINDLLVRVDLFVDFHAACYEIAKSYEFGEVSNIEPLFVGHSELNTRVTTGKGKFVIKFFNKTKEKAVCELVAESLLLFKKHHIPVPEIVKGPEGYLYELPLTIGKGYLIVMDYFEGKSFNEIGRSLSDKIAVVESLAKINTLHMDQEAAYDPWLLLYLAQEYDKKKHLLSHEDLALISPIVEQFRKIQMVDFSKGVVHYDLHRDNIQKGIDGMPCIFDMETVGNGYPVLDLATYLGLTCLETAKSIEENRFIYKSILAYYQMIRPLTKDELDSLDALTKSIYASNVIAANYLMKSEGDDTQETYKWYELGKEGLKVFGNASLM